MSETTQDQVKTLATLRQRIDAIDENMHRLLIERGREVDTLIKAKGTQRSGAAFRPGREADMMRRFADRHEGSLPLVTVEHIWREIITTFTWLQAPYDVAIDISVEPERMRDLARFMFGFSVAVDGLPGALNVIERVAAGRDLGIIARQTAGPWWLGLRGEQRPQIMAILPFIRVGGRPADLPAFVISPPLSDPKAPDFTVFVVTSPHKPAADGLVILAAAGDQHWLVADAGGRGPEAVAADLPAGAAVSAAGGFAAPIGADGSALDPALLALAPGGIS